MFSYLVFQVTMFKCFFGNNFGCVFRFRYFVYCSPLLTGYLIYHMHLYEPVVLYILVDSGWSEQATVQPWAKIMAVFIQWRGIKAKDSASSVFKCWLCITGWPSTRGRLSTGELCCPSLACPLHKHHPMLTWEHCRDKGLAPERSTHRGHFLG